MKSLKNLFVKMYSLLLLMFFAFACTQDDPVTLDHFNTELNKKVTVEYPIFLEGMTHFTSYALKEHRVIVSGDENFFYCDAILTHVNGQNYILETIETFALNPQKVRRLTWQVKMTPSGHLSFSWPDPEGVHLKKFEYLTGCIPYGGPGINEGTNDYKGSFDGKYFHAETHFMAKQEKFGNGVPFYKPPRLTELIGGPIRFEFSFELYKVEK